jgi:hypothetical protein
MLLEAALGSTWTPECLSPCDLRLPTSGVYRLRANGIKTSAPFSILAPADRYETLRVKEGNQALFLSGIAAVVIGPAVPALAVIPPSALPSGLSSVTPADILAATIVLGSAILVTGIVLLANNATTSVSQQSTPAPSVVPFWSSALTREGHSSAGPGGFTLLAW